MTEMKQNDGVCDDNFTKPLSLKENHVEAQKKPGSDNIW